jgi:hypothetical protein
MKYMRYLIKIAFLLSLIVVITTACACSAEANTSAASINSTVVTTTNSPSVTSISSRENIAQIVDGDILLSISTNKDTYMPGEVILVTASVENRSPNPVKYILFNRGDPTPYVYLEKNPYFSGFGLEEKGVLGRTVAPMYTGGQLKPYEIVKREVV